MALSPQDQAIYDSMSPAEQRDFDEFQASITPQSEADIFKSWSPEEQDEYRSFVKSIGQDLPDWAQKEERGFFGKISDSFFSGAAQTGQALSSTASAYGTDGTIAVTDQLKPNLTEERERLHQRLKAIDSDDPWYSEIAQSAAVIASEPQAMFQEIAAQMPNLAIAGGMAKAGAVVGTAVMPGLGTIAGSAIGGILGAGAGMFLANTALETGFILREAAEDGTLSEEAQDLAQQQGAIKGGVISTIDLASMGVNRLLMGRAGRVAEKAVVEKLTGAGVDITSDDAVRAALRANPDLLSDTLDVAQESLRRSAGRLGGAAVIESVAEGSGEYFGSQAAGLDASISDAVLEAVSSLPLSVAEIGTVKNLAARNPGKRTQLRNEVLLEVQARQPVAEQLLLEYKPVFEEVIYVDPDTGRGYTYEQFKDLGLNEVANSIMGAGTPGDPMSREINIAIEKSERLMEAQARAEQIDAAFAEREQELLAERNAQIDQIFTLADQEIESARERERGLIQQESAEAIEAERAEQRSYLAAEDADAVAEVNERAGELETPMAREMRRIREQLNQRQEGEVVEGVAEESPAETATEEVTDDQLAEELLESVRADAVPQERLGPALVSALGERNLPKEQRDRIAESLVEDPDRWRDAYLGPEAVTADPAEEDSAVPEDPFGGAAEAEETEETPERVITGQSRTIRRFAEKDPSIQAYEDDDGQYIVQFSDKADDAGSTTLIANTVEEFQRRYRNYTTENFESTREAEEVIPEAQPAEPAPETSLPDYLVDYGEEARGRFESDPGDAEIYIDNLEMEEGLSEEEVAQLREYAGIETPDIAVEAEEAPQVSEIERFTWNEDGEVRRGFGRVLAQKGDSVILELTDEKGEATGEDVMLFEEEIRSRKPIDMSIDQSPPQGNVAPQRVKEIARQRLGNTDLTVAVTRMSNLPQWVKDEARLDEPGATIKGFRMGDTVVIVYDQLESEKDAQVQIAHEAIGHVGFERIIPVDEFVPRFQTLKRSGSRSVNSILEEVQDRYGDVDEITQMKEFVAVAQERREKSSAVQRFVRQIKQAMVKGLRKLGVISENFSMTDLDAALDRADVAVQGPGEAAEGVTDFSRARKKMTTEEVQRSIEEAEPEVLSPVKNEAAVDALRQKINRKPGVGSPKNQRKVITINGKQEAVAGVPTMRQWMNRVERILTPEEIEAASTWYSEARGIFAEAFGEERADQMMTAWLISNQNVDPAGALHNALRVYEQTGSGAQGLQGGLADASLRELFAGRQPSKGIGPKLHDFIDSALGKDTRTYMGDSSLGGEPAVIDIHSARDMGYIDEAHLKRLKKKYGAKVADLTVDLANGNPSGPQYEFAAEQLRGLTNQLNKAGYLGGNLTPAQVQAIGWTAMAKEYDSEAFNAQQSIARNTRTLSYELDFGEGAPFAEEFPQFSELPYEKKAEVTESITSKIVNWAQDIVKPAVSHSFYGPGRYESYDIQPSGQTSIIGTREAAEDIADIIGYLAQQTEVYISRPMRQATVNDEKADSSRKLAVRITGITPEQAPEFWDRLTAMDPRATTATGFQPTETQDGAWGIISIRNQAGKREMAFLQQELPVMVDQVAQEMGINGYEYGIFHTDLTRRGNDWTTQKAGEGYLQGLTARYGPDIRSRLDDLRTEVEEDLRSSLDFSRTVRTEAGGERSDSAGGVPAGRERVTPPVRRGRIALQHFSTVDDLEITDPSYHGTGIRGAERMRKMLPNWVDRTYFGIETGRPGGYKVEPGLRRDKAYETEIEPERLYDFAANPDNLEKTDINAYEKAIKEAGYAGYWVNHPQLGMVAAVMEPMPVRKAGPEFDFSRSVNQQLRDRFRSAEERAARAASQYSAQNSRLREENETLYQQAARFLKKGFAPGGLLPDDVFSADIERESEIRGNAYEVQIIRREYERAVRKQEGAVGRSLSKNVIEAHAAILAGEDVKGVPANIKTPLIAMRQYLDQLSKEYLKVLEKEKLEIEATEPDSARAAAKQQLIDVISGNIGKYVHRSYQVFDNPRWFKEVPTKTVDAARTYLISEYTARGESLEESQRLADNAIDDLLKNGTAYESAEGLIRSQTLGAKDLSVLIKRKEIAQPILDLMGEYRDPRMNFVRSADKMTRLVFNHNFLEKVKASGQGVFLFSQKDAGRDITVQISAQDNPALAPIDGMWTSREVKKAFEDAVTPENLSPIYRQIIKYNGLVKYGKTVLSPTTAMRNVQSAAFFMVLNGHLPGKGGAKAAKAMADFMGWRTDEEAQKYVTKMRRLGVVYDSANGRELRELMKEAFGSETNFSDWMLAGGVKEKTARFFEGAQRFYMAGDDFWKIIGFESEKAQLIRAGVEEAEAETMAAERIRNTYPTYSMVGDYMQRLRRFPLVGTFVSFPSEIIRTSFNHLKYMQEDFKAGRTGMAARRAAGFAAASGTMYAVQALTKMLVGMDDDEEEAVRMMGPPWSENSNFAFLGRNEDGSFQQFDLSFLDPYNIWKRPINAILRDQPADEAAAQAAVEFLSPFLGTDIAFQSLLELYSNKKYSGGKIYDENGDIVDIMAKSADHIRKAVQPGVIANIERTMKAVTGERRSTRQPYDLGDEALAWLGWRSSTLNPEVSLKFKSFELRDALNEASGSFNRVLRDPNEVSDEELAEAYSYTLRKREEAFDRFGRLVSAARDSGMEDEAIFESINNAGISKRDTAALLSGEFPGWQPNIQTMKEIVREAANAGEGDQAMERMRRVRELMRSQR